VVHDPRDLGTAQRVEFEVALHGHTHRRAIERNDGRLVFNPGECAGHVAGQNAVGVVDLVSLETEILRF
jgi:predicted phosphodiesterase